MSQPFIVLGDKTSHGGTVITASPFGSTHGKGWARKGDMVSCPLCKGVFPIIQGHVGLTDDDKPVAYHGCKVACGATLISSQTFTTIEPLSGAVPGAGEGPIAQGFGSVGAGLIAGYQDEPLDNAQRFRGRFQLLDQATGEPLSGVEARVRSSDGQSLIGTTDAEGFTQWVERDAAEALAFDLTQQQP
jgi:uncharacterized Zn-binding protein involved in type VI secretion